MSPGPDAGRGQDPQKTSALVTSLWPWMARRGCSRGIRAWFGMGELRVPLACPGRDKEDPHPHWGARAGKKGEEVGKGRMEEMRKRGRK